MKKFRSILSIIALSTPLALIVPIASCNTIETKDFIQEPTIQQKQWISQEAGNTFGTFKLNLLNDIDNPQDINIETTITSNSNVSVHATASHIADKVLTIQVELSNLDDIGQTTVTFNMKLTNIRLSCSQTINEFNFTYIPKPLSDFTVDETNSIEYQDSYSFTLKSHEPKQAKVGSVKYESLTTDLISVNEQGLVSAIKGPGLAKLKITVTDSLGNSVDKIYDINITNEIYKLKISGERNLEINYDGVYEFTAVDQYQRSQTSNATWYLSDPELGTFEGNKLTLSSKAKQIGGNVDVVAKIGDTEYTYSVSIATFDKFNIERLKKGEAVYSKVEITGDVVMPSYYWNGATAIAITTIPSDGFRSCEITSFRFGQNLTHFFIEGMYALDHLTSLSIDDKNTTFIVKDNCLITLKDVDDYKAKTLCFGIKNSVISSDGNIVTSIGPSAFEYVKFVNSNLLLPANITNIGDKAFMQSTITQITFEGVKYIGQEAFKKCATLSLVKQTADTYIISIGEGAFAEDNELKTFQDGAAESLIYIGKQAFLNCSRLENFATNTTTLITVEDEAFKNCSVLNKINIPATCKTLGFDTFSGCDPTKLEVSFDLTSNKLWKLCDDYYYQYWWKPSTTPADNGYILACGTYTIDTVEAFDNTLTIETSSTDMTAAITARSENYTDLVFPNYYMVGKDIYVLAEIKDNVFYNMTTLESVKFAGYDYYIYQVDVPGMRKIGANAFKGCSNLKIAYINSDIWSIGDNCFDGCTSLKTLYINSLPALLFSDNKSCLYIAAEECWISNNFPPHPTTSNYFYQHFTSAGISSGLYTLYNRSAW